ncbi:MAG: cysteine desulfurase family protein [Anaerolineae bacterium]|nr:cysteine desulfurase family protein [Anaerolineae bacterium]
MTHIYLDYAATTPTDSRVLDAMMPFFETSFGNPSSVHRYGQQAEAAVEQARETVAQALNCRPKEVIFTSCGSESDNLALRGAAQAIKGETGRKKILTSRAEHDAVTQTAKQLAAHYGFTLGWLPVDEFGVVTPDAVKELISDEVAIVSVMYSNNEIGTINPIEEIAQVCHEAGAVLHTDAVQAAGYLPIENDKLDADLISLGGHKIYGPKGVGALYIREGTPILPNLTGGGQEFGIRAGTSNVPYIVGFGEALRLTVEERAERNEHVRPLRDNIIETILEEIPDSKLTGHPENRVSNHASFVFKDVDGNLLLQLLDSAGFACSSGSACKTGNPEPSEVIIALGLSPEWALGSLRVTLGRRSRPDYVAAFLDTLPTMVDRARSLMK